MFGCETGGGAGTDLLTASLFGWDNKYTELNEKF